MFVFVFLLISVFVLKHLWKVVRRSSLCRTIASLYWKLCLYLYLKLSLYLYIDVMFVFIFEVTFVYVLVEVVEEIQLGHQSRTIVSRGKKSIRSSRITPGDRGKTQNVF